MNQRLIARLRQCQQGSIQEEAANALEHQERENAALKNSLALIWRRSTDAFAVDEARRAIESLNA